MIKKISLQDSLLEDCSLMARYQAKNLCLSDCLFGEGVYSLEYPILSTLDLANSRSAGVVKTQYQQGWEIFMGALT
jgi:hypothetical protein